MGKKRPVDRSNAVNLESSVFYLHVAEKALADLEALPAGDLELGGWKFDPLRHDMPDDRFRHAVVCTVFAAAAVEHDLVALALFRKMGVRHPERQLLGAVWPRRLMGETLIAIARAVTPLEESLLGRISELMTRRNRIVHSQAFDWEQPAEGESDMIEWGFELPAITPQLIRDAPGDVAIAREALDAIRKVRGDASWSPFRR